MENTSNKLLMLGERKYFTYSTSVILITIFCLVVLLSVSGLLVYNIKRPYVLLQITVILILLVEMLYFLLRAPRYYILKEEGVYLKFVVGSAFYPKDRYEIATAIPYTEIRGAARTFGSGGYFGYTGLFYVPNRGKSTFYVTNVGGDLIRLIDREGGRTIYISQ